jgi:hypothetical protein
MSSRPKYLLLLLKGSALELSARLKKASNQLHRELEKTVLNGGKPELPESYVFALNYGALCGTGSHLWGEMKDSRSPMACSLRPSNDCSFLMGLIG